MAKSVEGIIDRIGYDPSWVESSGGGRGFLYLVLVDDNNVYKCWHHATIVYADVGSIVDEGWLLSLTQQEDHITFELEHHMTDKPFMDIKPRSLRNWTLEQRLSHSLKDITPLDKNLPHSNLHLPSDGS